MVDTLNWIRVSLIEYEQCRTRPIVSLRTIDTYKQLHRVDAFLRIVQRYNRIEQRQGR
jgi:hypothetical protein